MSIDEKMTIDEMVAVLQAYKAGKKIQVRSGANWVETKSPVWDFFSCTYRIAPEQLEIWVNEYNNRKWGGIHLQESSAKESAHLSGGTCKRTIHFREVL
jgi:hypothetical protein